MSKYIPAEKLIAEIERQKQENETSEDKEYAQYELDVACGYDMACEKILSIISFLQQDQQDFDDVDPKHLVHSHYTKVRETKTGRVFWAEYSSEAAEWYEAGTGKAYSISDVEIVKEQQEVNLEKEIDEKWDKFVSSEGEREDFTKIAHHFYELGLKAGKEK